MATIYASYAVHVYIPVAIVPGLFSDPFGTVTLVCNPIPDPFDRHTARLRRNILTLLTSLLVIFTATLIVVIFTLDLDAYRPELERGLSQALGVEFKIEGRLRFSLQPQLAITMGEVRLNQGETEIAAVKRMSVSFALLPLLRRELQIHRITLEHARLKLDAGTWPLLRDDRHTLPANTPTSSGLKWMLTQGSVYELVDSNLIYANEESPWHISMDALNLRLNAAELDPALWNEHGRFALALQEPPGG